MIVAMAIYISSLTLSAANLLEANYMGRYAESLIPYLTTRYGIHSLSELREAVEEDPKKGGRSYAWLMTWVNDPYAGLEAWNSVLEEDPADLEASKTTLWLYSGIDRHEKILELTERMAKVPLVLRDRRGRKSHVADIWHARCAALRTMNRLAEAKAACLKAIALGSNGGGQRTLAKILVAEGQPAAALKL